MRRFLYLSMIGLAAMILSGCAGNGWDDEYEERSVSLYALDDAYAIVMERYSGDTDLPDRFCIEFDRDFDDIQHYRLYDEDDRALEIEGRYRIRNGDLELEIDGDGDDLRDYLVLTSRITDNWIVEGDYYDIENDNTDTLAEYRVERILYDSCY